MEEIAAIIREDAKEKMQHVIGHYEKSLSNIRAGKASPAMLGSVRVDYYGNQVPLDQVANVQTIDAQTLGIQPWEKAMITEIEKGIMYANIGLNPMNNGDTVMVSIPPLTEERRRELSKQAKAEGESAKVSVRNTRKEANNELKKSDELSDDMKKVQEAEVQKLTDSFIETIDAMFRKKEQEIMTV